MFIIHYRREVDFIDLQFLVVVYLFSERYDLTDVQNNTQFTQLNLYDKINLIKLTVWVASE